MTSGNFSSFPLSRVAVHRDFRQRREIKTADVNALAESIGRLGLINPIVITRDGVLVAGEHRLLAAKQLNWTHINVQFQDELDSRELKAIELEENIKRRDIPWQDQVRAIAEIHELHKELDANWTQSQTAEAIGIDLRTFAAKLQVATELKNGTVSAAVKDYSTARNFVARKNQREKADEVHTFNKVANKVEAEVIQIADFLKWAPEYDGTPFNLLHFDPPYGINADKFDQGKAKTHGGYADTFDTYTLLLATLFANKARLLGESAHIIMWFSMKHYDFTLRALQEHFWVDPYPLIWMKSDGKGILPDPTRGPRRNYEVAFLASHGDRHVVRPVGNIVGADTTSSLHMSEKPQAMLEHFFRMIVDENTRLLDPTCGSGSALRAAKALGARSVLGLEINEDFAKQARLAFAKENE